MSKTMKSLEQLKAGIERLDLSEENKQIEAHEAEMTKIRSKIQEAEARSSELSMQIREYSGPDPDAIVDAMMEGKGAEEAATLSATKEQLIDENKAIRVAIGRMHELVRVESQKRDQVRLDAATKVADIAQPYMDELQSQQEQAAETLVAAYAATSLLNDVSKRFVMEERKSRTATKGVTGSDGFLQYQRELEVPKELFSALKQLEGKGPSLRLHLREKIIMW